MPDDQLPAVAKSDYGTEIQNFESGLLQRLVDFGLPTGSILVPVTERATVFNNAPAVLERLAAERKINTIYISKFLGNERLKGTHPGAF